MKHKTNDSSKYKKYTFYYSCFHIIYACELCLQISILVILCISGSDFMLPKIEDFSCSGHCKLLIVCVYVLLNVVVLVVGWCAVGLKTVLKISGAQLVFGCVGARMCSVSPGWCYTHTDLVHLIIFLSILIYLIDLVIL